MGTCRFCGRAVCTQHAQTRPFVLSVADHRIPVQRTVVDDALHCGGCTVHVEGVLEQELAEVER
jgi:hypothetical protein